MKVEIISAGWFDAESIEVAVVRDGARATYRFTPVSVHGLDIMQFDSQFHRDFSENLDLREWVIGVARRAGRGSPLEFPMTFDE